MTQNCGRRIFFASEHFVRPRVWGNGTEAATRCNTVAHRGTWGWVPWPFAWGLFRQTVRQPRGITDGRVDCKMSIGIDVPVEQRCQSPEALGADSLPQALPLNCSLDQKSGNCHGQVAAPVPSRLGVEGGVYPMPGALPKLRRSRSSCSRNGFLSDHGRSFGDPLLSSVGHYEGSARGGVGRGRLDIPWRKRNLKAFLSD